MTKQDSNSSSGIANSIFSTSTATIPEHQNLTANSLANVATEHTDDQCSKSPSATQHNKSNNWKNIFWSWLGTFGIIISILSSLILNSVLPLWVPVVSIFLNILFDSNTFKYLGYPLSTVGKKRLLGYKLIWLMITGSVTISSIIHQNYYVKLEPKLLDYLFQALIVMILWVVFASLTIFLTKFFEKVLDIDTSEATNVTIKPRNNPIRTLNEIGQKTLSLIHWQQLIPSIIVVTVIFIALNSSNAALSFFVSLTSFFFDKDFLRLFGESEDVGDKKFSDSLILLHYGTAILGLSTTLTITFSSISFKKIIDIYHHVLNTLTSSTINTIFIYLQQIFIKVLMVIVIGVIITLTFYKWSRSSQKS